MTTSRLMLTNEALLEYLGIDTKDQRIQQCTIVMRPGKLPMVHVKQYATKAAQPAPQREPFDIDAACAAALQRVQTWINAQTLPPPPKHSVTVNISADTKDIRTEFDQLQANLSRLAAKKFLDAYQKAFDQAIEQRHRPMLLKFLDWLRANRTLQPANPQRKLA